MPIVILTDTNTSNLGSQQPKDGKEGQLLLFMLLGGHLQGPTQPSYTNARARSSLFERGVLGE